MLQYHSIGGVIMEFLVLWLGTSLASFGMEIANELRMFKDAADAGYKVDVKKLSELGKQLNPNATKATLLSMLIPIFNVMQVFQRTIQYNNVRPMILDQLSVIDALEEMSEIEKAEYLKKPTGLNALIVPLKTEIRLSKATSIKINDGNEHSEIYYEMGESLDDITILKVSGSASRLTVEEQKKKVVESWKTIVQAGMKKYGDPETFIDNLKSNTDIDLRDSKEDKKEEETISSIPQKLSISEQKRALENLKRELLDEKEAVQSTKGDKEPTFSKRKK